ncbi:ImmA/IrrE family metallo-endopeptidase [Lentibacillus salinarum]|uniref:ImmA/IrrE family metallo-endopeptidase n=1 Tax=Lentibacillus salinarum TaxID=446820 RepID=A0ABW3ZWC9_9BACI
MTWIKNIVHQVEKKYKSNNPFEICSLMNIHVIPWDLHKEINGFYKYDRRNKYIFINYNLSDEMQRFVCSHELGHAVLHPRSNTPFLRNKTLFSIDKNEVEANTFAVELLMDDEKINKFKETNLSIQEIGKICGVPGKVVHLKNLSNK